MQNKIETEIKLILGNCNLNESEELISRIEKVMNLERTAMFHQTTHQFFEDDYTKQTAFPRIRNEQNGDTTLTVKAKIKNEIGQEIESNYFKRVELETNISNTENVIAMMPFFGFKNKISWEKKRINFLSENNDTENYQLDFAVSLDETPMGYFLEIESSEDKIEEVIKLLGLSNLERSNKPYLALWEDYKKVNKVGGEMRF